MNIKLGEKIRTLRKRRNISQEVLAQYLGVSFQAVSKWETGTTMPDVALIPAIASFFGVSTDELFDFNLMEIEKKVEQICNESWRYRNDQPEKAEEILRDGLKKFPGNDILLNNLLYTIRSPERSGEVIDICKSLIEGTRSDEVKYDAYRILAEVYKDTGEYALAKDVVEHIPEIYFTKLQIKALLLNGEDMYEAAHKQKNLSAEHLIQMLVRLADYYTEKSAADPACREKARIQLTIAKRVLYAFQDDFTAEFFSGTVYDYMADALEEIERRLNT